MRKVHSIFSTTAFPVAIDLVRLRCSSQFLPAGYQKDVAEPFARGLPCELTMLKTLVTCDPALCGIHRSLRPQERLGYDVQRCFSLGKLVPLC